MKRVAITCAMCDKEFNLNPRIGINWAQKTGRGIYCTRECHQKSRLGNHTSPSTEFKKGHITNYKNGVWSYRKYLKDKCEDCGTHEKLIIHHIDHIRTNNNPKNLRTVCSHCHFTIHHPRQAWNKGKKLPSLSDKHKQKISNSVRKYYGQVR